MIPYTQGNIFGCIFLQDDIYDPLEQYQRKNSIQGLADFFRCGPPTGT